MFNWGLFSYSDCYSVFSEGLVSVFEWAILLSIVILLFVFSLCISILWIGGFSIGGESLFLEFIWTLLPILVLVFLGYPSIMMMYMFSVDSLVASSVGVVGCQWYWLYNINSNVTGSYIEGGFRLLDVDCRLVINSGLWYNVYITSNDVIHSWAIPSLGLNLDAIPGRVNSLDLFCSTNGVYYGQCSELCGVGHTFMPVCLEVVCD